MHSCLVPCYLHSRSKMLADVFQQHISAFSVDGSHSPDMTHKVAFSDEVSQHRLTECRRADVKRKSCGKKTLHQIFGYDQVPQPKRRKQHLAEGTDVDNA